MFVLAVIISPFFHAYPRIIQLLAMKRVGVLQGGIPLAIDEKVIPPSQRLKIAQYAELASPYASSIAYSDNNEKSKDGEMFG
jgi:hypothetical protein